MVVAMAAVGLALSGLKGSTGCPCYKPSRLRT
jgi:hypothetical protein